MGDPSGVASTCQTVKQGRVAERRVYCDNEPIREKMRLRRKEQSMKRRISRQPVWRPGWSP
jgi:hypothetical protein